MYTQKSHLSFRFRYLSVDFGSYTKSLGNIQNVTIHPMGTRNIKNTFCVNLDSDYQDILLWSCGQNYQMVIFSS